MDRGGGGMVVRSSPGVRGREERKGNGLGGGGCVECVDRRGSGDWWRRKRKIAGIRVSNSRENTVSLDNDHYVMAVKCHVRWEPRELFLAGSWIVRVGIRTAEKWQHSILCSILLYSVPARDPTSHTPYPIPHIPHPTPHIPHPTEELPRKSASSRSPQTVIAVDLIRSSLHE